MRRRRNRIQLRLPERSPREAMVLFYLLDRIDRALWRVYGDEVAEIAGAGLNRLNPRPRPVV